MKLPFSLFYRADRHSYYVAFKNENTGTYLPAVSTKKDNEADALRQAWAWFREGIPRRGGGKVDLKAAAMLDMIRHSDLSMSDAEFIFQDLKRRGLVVSCVLSNTPAAVRLSDFLTDFWDWEQSPYIREKLRAEHSIHRNYVNGMLGDVNKYWISFFPSILLGEITPIDIENFIDNLSKIISSKHGRSLSNIRKNGILRAGLIPLRWAYRKGKIKEDITKGIMLFSGISAVRKIVTPEMAASIFGQSWADERCKLANMTAMITGLRAGELQGLLYEDIGNDCLFVRHSWNRLDRLKVPKTVKERIVELPFPSVLASLKMLAETNPHGVNNKSFVFWASVSANKPMEQKLFTVGLRKSLIAVGVNNADTFTFHGWRHFFTSYMRKRIEDKLLKTQTGHSTIAMIERYSAHLLPGDREKIREAQCGVFASLLPS